MAPAFAVTAAALAVAILTPIPGRLLVAQELGLRAAVVPGSTEVLVSAGGPGWLIGVVLGEQEGTFALPGGSALGIVPLVVAGIGFADVRGDWFSMSRFPVGTAAGLGFVAQAMAVDLVATSLPATNVRVSPIGRLRVPELGGVANVIILFGQSNAEGYAELQQLPPVLRARVPEARIWNDVTGTWQALQPGTNNTTLQNPNWCGPEITLADSLVGNGDVVHLFKFAVGQTALGPTPGPWNEWGVAANELYFELMRRFDNARGALLQSRMQPIVRGICMMQGESDALAQTMANEYKVLLDALVRRMRSDLVTRGVAATPDVPFVMGLINRELISTGFQFVDTVRAAQTEVAASLPQMRTVETTGLPLKPDNVHFDTAGMMTLGRRMATELVSMAVTPQATSRSLRDEIKVADGTSIWRVLHLVGAALLLLGLCLILALPQQGRSQALARACHGLGFLTLLASGIAIMAATNMLSPARWPLWLTLHVAVWLLLGMLPWVMRRTALPRPLGWLVLALLGTAAFWLGYGKPFGG